jgi:CheW-like domain
MLRASKQQDKTVAAKRSWNLLVFSIGGERLAARTEDVGGIAPWINSIAVPSRTPFVQAMLRREKELLPVYDLAARLNRSLLGDPLLCLVAKHVDGPMAICIDGDMPSLHTIDAGALQLSIRTDIETIGSFNDGNGEIPIVAIQTLGGSGTRRAEYATGL